MSRFAESRGWAAAWGDVIGAAVLGTDRRPLPAPPPGLLSQELVAPAGDRAAELRLSKVRADAVRSAGADSQVAELRAAAGADPDAARQLCTLLFELRDGDGLRAELEAGTYGAADRLIALYTADETMPPEQLLHLRAFGLTADGQPIPTAPPMTFRKDI